MRPVSRLLNPCLLLLAATPASYAQSLSPAAADSSRETSAVWLARVQYLSHPGQVAALRERLQADAHRTFRNDPSQMAVCLVGVSAISRAAWEAAHRSAPDTVVHDTRVLFVLNGRLLNGPEAARALAAVPARAIRPLHFLTGTAAQTIYGARAEAGVVVVTTR